MDPAIAMGTEAFGVAARIRQVTPPTPPPSVPCPRVSLWAGGFRLSWPEAPPSSFAAVRALGAETPYLESPSPFCDERGRFFWVRSVEAGHLWVPWHGLPRATTRLQIDFWQYAGSRLELRGRSTAPVTPDVGRAWTLDGWATPLVVLAVAVIHADGRVQRSEAQSLLHFSQTAGLQGVDWTAALLRPTPALLGPAVEGTRLRWPDWGPRTLLERLTGLCGAGAGEPERRVLLEIGGWLGAPAAAVDHVFAGRSGSSEVEIRRACEILGLPSTASAEEARAAWRARVAAHHPDRVARRGEVAVAEATRQVQAYNAAWQVLATALSDSIVAPPRAVEVPNNPPPANAPWDRVLKTLGTWVFGTGGR